MLYLQTTVKTSETTHVFNYGERQCMYFTAVKSEDYATIETSQSEDGKLTLVISGDNWDSRVKTYLGIHRIFLTMESLQSYLGKFNKYYKQENKLIGI